MTIQQSEIAINPFAVKTPENLSAEELVDLFVPYPEFENLQVGGHQFLNGHRGSGKSMMLRMMSPDSQMLSRHCQFFELPYFGVYLTIKETELSNPEYARLEDEISGTILSEHVLTTRILSALFSTIKSHCSSLSLNNIKLMVTKVLFSRLKYAGWDEQLPTIESKEFETVSNILAFIIELIDDIHLKSTQYIKRRAFSSVNQPYQGTLIGFQDVLLPVIQALSEHEIIPTPVYFLLDDADNLTKQQTKILNTWVYHRTTRFISLKISTQLSYKTYETTSGVKIEDPHDFSSIHFTSVYTGSAKERYKKLVADVVERRLIRYACKTKDPYVFFPKDENQELAIKKIEAEFRDKWMQGESGSYRPYDDVYRYARPEYIRRLSGISKQGSSYKYAGFEQLVHISSGIIRFFLEPAARMFTEQLLKNSDDSVIQISPSVQDQELRNQSEKLLLSDLEDLVQEGNEIKTTHRLTDIEKLRNIVHGIGALFKAHIMDETSTQRRVFSFSISGEPSQDIKKILKLGVIHGYFYEDSIGTKDGMGRTILYVLTRRLAPSFSLDPIGFSGYLTVPASDLLQIAERPLSYNSRLRKKGVDKLFSNSGQLLLLGVDNHE